MRPFSFRLLLLIAVCLPALPVWAQHWLGLTPSNYAGLNAVFQQPAQVADSRYRLYVNGVGVDGYAYTNAVRWAAPYSIGQFGLGLVPTRFRDAQGGLRFSPDYLAEQLNGHPKKHLAGVKFAGRAC